MKVKDLISKTLDNYQPIKISEFKGLERTGNEWRIEPHAKDYIHIPKRIWNKEIDMIILYYDCLAIVVQE